MFLCYVRTKRISRYHEEMLEIDITFIDFAQQIFNSN